MDNRYALARELTPVGVTASADEDEETERAALVDIERVLAAIHGSDDEDEDDLPTAVRTPASPAPRNGVR